MSAFELLKKVNGAFCMAGFRVWDWMPKSKKEALYWTIDPQRLSIWQLATRLKVRRYVVKFLAITTVFPLLCWSAVIALFGFIAFGVMWAGAAFAVSLVF